MDTPPLPRSVWQRALEDLERAHRRHGYIPRHVVADISASIDRDPETLVRRYQRDLRTRGLLRAPRLTESAVEIIVDAPDLLAAHGLLEARTDLDYPSLEQTVMSTPGISLGPLLRREETRRRSLEVSASCPSCDLE